MKKTGMRQAKEIRARISRRLALWESGSHTGLVGGMEAEGAVREEKVTWEEVDEEVGNGDSMTQ